MAGGDRATVRHTVLRAGNRMLTAAADAQSHKRSAACAPQSQKRQCASAANVTSRTAAATVAQAYRTGLAACAARTRTRVLHRGPSRCRMLPGQLGCVSLVCGAAAQRTAPTARLGRMALGTVEVALPLRAADRENIPAVLVSTRTNIPAVLVSIPELTYLQYW